MSLAFDLGQGSQKALPQSTSHKEVPVALGHATSRRMALLQPLGRAQFSITLVCDLRGWTGPQMRVAAPSACKESLQSL